MRVRLAYGGGQGYPGGLEQGVFDEAGLDVVAAADDEVFLATTDAQVAVGIQATQVTGDEEAIGQEGALVLGRVEVATRHAGATHQHHAVFIHRAIAQHLAARAHLDDAQLHIGHAQAGAAAPHFAITRV